MYNETNRIRNLAVVSALWSPRVVRHYGWNTAAQGQMKLLRACAIKHPHFSNQFYPQLNRILLDRHCEAISLGRFKTLNEAPLQIQHFASLLDDASRSDEQVDVRCLDQTDPMLVPLNELTGYLKSRPDLEKDLYAPTARSVEKCHRPLFTMLKRSRLLESLSEGFNDSRPSTMLKAMSISFNTISFPGAFSGAYLDTLAGSW